MFVVAYWKIHSVLLSAVNCANWCRPTYLVLLSMIFTIPRCFFVLFPTLSGLRLKEVIESFSLDKTLNITEV